MKQPAASVVILAWAILAPMQLGALQIPLGGSVGSRDEAMRVVASVWSGNRSVPIPPSVIEGAVRRLDELGVRAPEDDWILGHRIGLRLGLNDFDDALAILEGCRASEWWCNALRGVVRQAMGEFAAADTVFRSAWVSMPGGERCAWIEEMSLLIRGDALRNFTQSSCSERHAMDSQIWWVSDPLFLLDGNDRWTEHLSRVVTLRLHDQAGRLHGDVCKERHSLVFGPVQNANLRQDARPGEQGHHEGILRTGWGAWREIYDALPAGRSGVGLIPSGEVLTHSLFSTMDDWRIPSLWRSGDELYNPPYLPIHELDQQTAFFLRGDSVTVASAIDLLGHPLGVGPVEVGLILARSEIDTRTIAREQGTAPDRFVFRAMIPAERHLVGMEVLTENRGAARARFGHGLPEFTPEGVGLSDLLLFRWSPELELEEDLEVIAPRMLGSTRIVRGQSMGVFFEIYGVESEERIEVSLTIAPVQGAVARFLSALRLSRSQGIRTGWEEGAVPEGMEYVGRALHLDLSSLPVGRFLLELRIRTSGGEEVVSRTEIDLAS